MDSKKVNATIVGTYVAVATIIGVCIIRSQVKYEKCLKDLSEGLDKTFPTK